MVQTICEEHDFVTAEYTATGMLPKTFTQCRKCGTLKGYENKYSATPTPSASEGAKQKEAKDVHYKWSKIFAGKRYNNKPVILDPLEQHELLQDIKSIKAL